MSEFAEDSTEIPITEDGIEVPMNVSSCPVILLSISPDRVIEEKHVSSLF